jgi:ADP-ribose pyrophosphatase YjhB (NUDIX family)
MLHLIVRVIPAPLHRQGYRVAFRLRKAWLGLTGQTIHGCTMIARDAQGRVLLVRHSYGSTHWSLPGGGMNKGEDPLAAAMREFTEELACTVSDPRHLGTLGEDYHGAHNVAHVFTGLIAGEPRPDMRELVAARFFALDDLPPDTARAALTRLRMLQQG